MQKVRLKIADIAYAALFVAVISVCSWITVPFFAVPFTLQTFAVFLTLLLLGGKMGTVSVLVYILLGALGVPVFSGFRGGISVLFGATGGYIIGFLFIGITQFFMEKIFGKNRKIQIISMTIGLVIMYVFGTLWFVKIYIDSGSDINVLTALKLCVIPFVIPDLAKLLLAFLVSKRMAKVIPKI